VAVAKKKHPDIQDSSIRVICVVFLHFEQLDGHHDGGQDVVEIVGDAAGQRADLVSIKEGRCRDYFRP